MQGRRDPPLYHGCVKVELHVDDMLFALPQASARKITGTDCSSFAPKFDLYMGQLELFLLMRVVQLA
jgi:hypothetical protein